MIDLEKQTVDGVAVILSYDNIAIVVLMVMVLLESILIGVLLRGLLKMKDVFFALSLAINTLNERLNNHD